MRIKRGGRPKDIWLASSTGHVTHNMAKGRRALQFRVWGHLDREPDRSVVLVLDEDSAARLAWNLTARFGVEPRHVGFELPGREDVS